MSQRNDQNVLYGQGNIGETNFPAKNQAGYTQDPTDGIRVQPVDATDQRDNLGTHPGAPTDPDRFYPARTDEFRSTGANHNTNLQGRDYDTGVNPNVPRGGQDEYGRNDEYVSPNQNLAGGRDRDTHPSTDGLSGPRQYDITGRVGGHGNVNAPQDTTRIPDNQNSNISDSVAHDEDPNLEGVRTRKRQEVCLRGVDRTAHREGHLDESGLRRDDDDRQYDRDHTINTTSTNQAGTHDSTQSINTGRDNLGKESTHQGAPTDDVHDDDDHNLEGVRTRKREEVCLRGVDRTAQREGHHDQSGLRRNEDDDGQFDKDHDTIDPLSGSIGGREQYHNNKNVEAGAGVRDGVMDTAPPARHHIGTAPTTGKAGLEDKIKGAAEKFAGKVVGNTDMQQHGHDRKAGQLGGAGYTGGRVNDSTRDHPTGNRDDASGI